MTLRLSYIAWLIASAILTILPIDSVAADAVLTNAADILSLTAEEARREISISVTGIVTVAENAPNWKSKFFVQDQTGGVFVNNTNSAQPAVGDVVEVSGLSHPGGFAPDITAPIWVKRGTAPLPAAKPTSAVRLMSGVEDGQRVEISGVVRSAQKGKTKLLLELASGGYRFRAFAPGTIDLDPTTLVGAIVRVRGTAAASFNAPLRHILTVAMFVPLESDVIVDQPADTSILNGPFTSLDAIAQYRKNGTPDSRIRVKGVVTYQRPGEDIFLLDATGGLQVKSTETNRIAIGEIVEAIGFPDLEGFLPILQDATLTRTKEPPQSVTPKEATLEQLLKGLHHADPITLEGKLLDRSVRRVGVNNRTELKSVFILQNSNSVFAAEIPAGDAAAELAEIPVGSMLRISGICLLQLGEEGRAETFQMLVPDARQIKILETPSWWTPDRLLTGLAVVLTVLIVAVIWSVMIMRKNSALRVSIDEKVKTQQELQKAHDLLEWRVRERTKQLKFEMTARKEAEVQFRATLKERTRLAQELHDTLEQSLTGIGLQLDTAGKLSGKEQDRANHHLELARSLMTQSQLELRRSIWDLRSRELEQFDLASALQASGRQMLDGTGIEFRVSTEGQVRPLSEVVEENLLRIGREALTNVIKHSGAESVVMELKFSARCVTLSITDDGKGFVPETSVGAKEGHFGLTGMRERARRLDGEFTIESKPGEGACLRVEIPLSPTPMNGQENGEGVEPA